MPLGLPELLVILVILVLIFGPKRLPGLGRQLGTGMREFKDSITGKTPADEEDQAGPALPEAAASTAPPVAPPAEAPRAEEPAPPRG